jgi:predicted SAM-dependent methyltransferase
MHIEATLPKFQIKLDLGAGEISPHGFRPMGRGHGSEIYPLEYADETVDEIRASHVLEHYPYRALDKVVGEWVRCLKKGGKLKIAVPDFATLAKDYLEGVEQPHESYLLGGQQDINDYHKSMFDRDRLRKLLADAGLVLIEEWRSEIDDCAGYPISLNLEARKPHVSKLTVSGCMSTPRLGFMENFFSCFEACVPCNVKLRKHGGAFWGQSMTKVFERTIEQDNPDLILTIDYDTVMTAGHLSRMIQTMMLFPEIDALAPIQSSRHHATTLFTVAGGDGKNVDGLPRTALDGDTTPVSTAHFGLTLLRTAALKKMAKPWFHSVPDGDGSWGEGHVDDDIQFWRGFEAAGNSLHLANRVAIGHMELQVLWPDINLNAMHQPVTDYQQNGIPEGVWK